MQMSNQPETKVYLTDAPGLQTNSIYSKYLKRLFDILCAFVGLVLALPVFLMIAIAIKLDSKGSVIFTQPRLGRLGTIFMIIKFRTMVVDAEKMGTKLVVNDSKDSRITRVGRFLRKTSLDELPQLFNILRGNMSIVGPRPPVVYWPYKGIENYPDWAKRRFQVKPGLTGLAQVLYRNDATWEERFKLDNKYIDKIGFRFDIELILKTAVLVLKRNNIY